MRENFSFRTTLLLSFWFVLLMALLLPSWYFYRSLTEEVLAEAQRAAIQQLNLVHWMMTHEEDFEDAEDLHEWLAGVGRQLGLRITYVAEGGRVIADTEFPFSEVANMDNFGNRPEIVQALNEDVGIVIRYSRIDQKQRIYVARAIQRKAGIPGGVLRLATPYSNVKDVLYQLKRSFFLVALLIFSATALLSRALVRRLKDPIRTLVEATGAIANRDFNRRIRFSPSQEFYPLAQSINHMAQNIESLVQTITQQKEQLEAVFNGMQEGVMVLDSKGKIRSVNRTLSELIPSALQSIGRRPMEVIVSLELQEACERALALGSNNPASPDRLQIVLRGERIYDITTATFADRPEGVGVIVVFHDITELKRLEKVRQDFVANVSRELRTPLTSIKGYAETLRSEEKHDAETASSSLDVILKNANHMLEMVDDLLLLATLEAQRAPTKSSPVNAREALAAAWKDCTPLAETEGVRLKNRLPEEGPHIYADFGQLALIFRHLLENGIRYSPPGEGVTVDCALEGDRVTFSVRNEGPGIPKHYQQRIFERFYRVEGDRGSPEGSTGLGLAICRHIIMNHGGTIWVQSPNANDTKGATFFFTMLAAPN